MEGRSGPRTTQEPGYRTGEHGRREPVIGVRSRLQVGDRAAPPPIKESSQVKVKFPGSFFGQPKDCLSFKYPNDKVTWFNKEIQFFFVMSFGH